MNPSEGRYDDWAGTTVFKSGRDATEGTISVPKGTIRVAVGGLGVWPDDSGLNIPGQFILDTSGAEFPLKEDTVFKWSILNDRPWDTVSWFWILAATTEGTRQVQPIYPNRFFQPEVVGGETKLSDDGEVYLTLTSRSGAASLEAHRARLIEVLTEATNGDLPENEVIDQSLMSSLYFIYGQPIDWMKGQIDSSLGYVDLVGEAQLYGPFEDADIPARGSIPAAGAPRVGEAVRFTTNPDKPVENLATGIELRETGTYAWSYSFPEALQNSPVRNGSGNAHAFQLFDANLTVVATNLGYGPPERLELTTAITPVAPTLKPADTCSVEGTVVIPKTEGIKYTETRDGRTVTVTAAAEPGFVLAEGATAKWTLEIPEVEPCPEVVTPVAPTLEPADLCGVEGTVVIPKTEGVKYTEARDSRTVTVTAEAEKGYVLAEGTKTEWTLEIPEAEACPPELAEVTPVRPTITESTECGVANTLELPTIEGVVYTVGEPDEDGDLTITATAKDGYVIAEGAPIEWKANLGTVVPCEEPEEPVAPVEPEQPVVTEVSEGALVSTGSDQTGFALAGAATVLLLAGGTLAGTRRRRRRA
ncbi:LPXTG cell wall anchor domain-containing protein [Leucobacter sp. HY1910]